MTDITIKRADLLQWRNINEQIRDKMAPLRRTNRHADQVFRIANNAVVVCDRHLGESESPNAK